MTMTTTPAPAVVRRPGGIFLAILGALITTAAIIVALIIGAAICLYMYYSGHATIANHTHDAGNWLTQPFHDVIHQWHGKYHLVANWGLAAAVYLAGGMLLVLAFRAAGAVRTVGARPAAAPPA